MTLITGISGVRTFTSRARLERALTSLPNQMARNVAAAVLRNLDAHHVVLRETNDGVFGFRPPLTRPQLCHNRCWDSAAFIQAALHRQLGLPEEDIHLPQIVGRWRPSCAGFPSFEGHNIAVVETAGFRLALDLAAAQISPFRLHEFVIVVGPTDSVMPSVLRAYTRAGSRKATLLFW